ncbi:uncharacterized protein RJT21DRAFT_42736 [Scheffersomyces amazonensis]|uniref:uncharacterized protein n=1 Tax=Scheffersomyces amazonensis TaxID=1078765 RepID=UPI00315D78A9
MVTTMTKERQETISRFNKQLWQAGVAGCLEGTLIGLLSGWYISYKYNHGHNTKFFRTPHKFWYLVSWNIVGIIFSTDIAKMRISKQIAIEDEIRRNLIEQELYSTNRKNN